MSIKLPKQWEHWCKDQKLSIHGRKYKKTRTLWFYLQGKGFVWRVNCHGMFQRGDSLVDFDRWALCEIDELPLPKSQNEFREAVKYLASVYKGEKE